MEPGAASRAYLPDDLVADILTRLPARSVCRFRAVCRSWRALATERQFVLAHAARDRAAAVPMNHHHRDGIVVVVRSPMPDGGEFIAGYAHPDTFAFHLMYCCHNQGKVIFQVIKAGDSQWREIAADRLAISGIDFDKQGISSVALHGGLHWQLRTNSGQWVMLVYDMVTEKFRSMAAPQCATTWVRGLSVLSGRLCSIVIPESMTAEIWVLEDYHEHRSWHCIREIDMAASAERINLENFWDSDLRMFLKVDVKQGIEHEVQEIIIHHGNKIISQPCSVYELRRNEAVYNVRHNVWHKSTMCFNGESIMYKESIVPYQMSFGMKSQFCERKRGTSQFSEGQHVYHLPL
uniref:F-box domain-containing protein n=1 Tax=Oryza barthii TaxID=65489 RepID=A0A0D3HDB3_9ORYZ